MKTKPKIGPLTVWLVGHTQNPLVSEVGREGDLCRPLAVFMKQSDARTWCKANETIRKVYKATIIRENTGPDYKAQRDAAERETILVQNELKQVRAELAAMDQWGKNCTEKNKAAWREVTEELSKTKEDLASCEVARQNAVSELESLRKQLNDGKIWNAENPRWTPRTQAALALAAKEATAQGATYVGTDHLLLGLLRQQEGIAHRHFLACGMTYEKAEYAMRVGRCS